MKRPLSPGLLMCLAALCISMSVLPAFSQDNKKIVIIKKEIDPDGNMTIDKEIRKGLEADEMLNAMDADEFKKSRALVLPNSESQKLGLQLFTDESPKSKNREVTIDEKDGKKTITVDVDGDVEVFELQPGEELPEDVKARLAEKGVIIEGDKVLHADRIIWHQDDGDNDNNYFRNITVI